MRVVNLQEFLAMPEGTIFQKWGPRYFQESLMVKLESWKEDFYYLDVVAMPDDEVGDGAEHPLDHGVTARDGCFEDSQLFAIFSGSDVAGIISNLKGN